MFFYQNPNAKSSNITLYNQYNTKMNLNCIVFGMHGDKYVAHYYFLQNRTQLAIDIKNETNTTVVPQFLVNRSESNENYFQATFRKDLEFLAVKNEMFFNIESEGREMVSNET